MIRVGIVEDDASASDTLQRHLKRYTHDTGVTFAVSTFSDGADIVDTYAPEYDLLFLDIEMQHLDGLATARQVRQADPDVTIFFITEMPQYAIRGYEVAAFTYLLKPVPYFSFSQDLTRALGQLRHRDEGSLVVTIGGTVHRVPFADLLYVESLRHRMYLHTRDGSPLSFTGTMKAIEEELVHRGFFRSNNGYLVNLRYVVSVGQGACTLEGGIELAVSRARRRGLMEALTDFVGGRSL